MVHQDQDHYSVLGIKAKATAIEVKRAYRNLCKQYHPDKLAHLDETTKREREAQMVKLNVAYQVLNSPKQRSEYDLAQPCQEAPQPKEPGETNPSFDGTPTPSNSRTSASNSSSRFRYPYSAKFTQRSRQARRMDPAQYTTHIDGRAAEFKHRAEDVNEANRPYSPHDPELQRPMPWEQREMDLVKEWMQAYCPPEPPEEQYQWTRASDHFLRNLREKRQQRGHSGKPEMPSSIPVATVQL
mmetsp:Transcript_95609/g.117150  ORF Transcript_95609/g.117150 Transcript_95609/m.117150 type:complete len:241 (-) Transcript_95609:33-755(-)|eukprot:CAMPEP_0114643960 /NCGR_PEP_ID=MMETSP0191-20121206/3694_1 /TAXON_ID=126664 /ORGANISM="Sorites sp." /LENGTH=240 /DNA_ID=CAMNT_0001856353 /DNA_START=92 /DNA_END=814 /DNA_ORIENTATION=+